MALSSRNNHPPGGFQWYQAETKWTLKGGLPFSMAVDAIVRHRRANPAISLSTDPATVAEELDAYTCARLHNDPNWCKKKVVTVPSLPPSPLSVPRVVDAQPVVVASVVERAHQVSQGIPTLASWIGHGANPVSQSEADRRAFICGACPINVRGSLAEIVIGGIADAIRATVGLKNHLKLKTQADDKLGTCDACGCHLPLKVWVPADEIRKSLTEEILGECSPQCWMRRL